MIHHATAKKAEASGVVLIEREDDGHLVVDAWWPERNRRLVMPAPAKDVLADMLAIKTIVLEWPGFRYVREGDDWVVTHSGDEMGRDERLADALAEALEVASEQGIDPSEEADNEEEEEGNEEGNEEEGETEDGAPVSVVSAKYKTIYRERGNADHCGDWLATQFDGAFDHPDGGFDPSAFLATLRENGVPLEGKWVRLPQSGTRGWQGRFRMSGRLKLEPILAARGYLVMRGERIQLPKRYLDELWVKHPEAKEAYAERE